MVDKLLNGMLSSLKNGELSVEEAQEWLEQNYQRKPNAQPQQAGEPSQIKKKIENLKENQHVEDLLKASTNLLQQIGDMLPDNLEKKLQTGVRDLSLQPTLPGVQARLSVFRASLFSEQAKLEDNQATGVTSFDFQVTGSSYINGNRFSAVYLNSFHIESCKLRESRLHLGRFNSAHFENSQLSFLEFNKSNFTDFALEDSSCESVAWHKCQATELKFENCQLKQIQFKQSNFHETEFVNCNMAGIQFKNCKFSGSGFMDMTIPGDGDIVLDGYDFTGCSLCQINGVQEFLRAVAPYELRTQPDTPV